MENTQEYKDIPDVDADIQRAQQKEMKSRANERFWRLLFLKQADQGKYSHLLREWRQAYANKQRDLYPDDLPAMFEVMKTVQIKKKLKNRSQDNDKNKNNGDLNGNNVQPGAESFA